MAKQGLRRRIEIEKHMSSLIACEDCLELSGGQL
jgi:hypothetical protein